MRYSLIWLIMATLLWCNPVKASEVLKASWYSNESLRREGTWAKGETMMANGNRFNENAMTCACRLYPLGTKLLITNLNNKKKVLVVVTDRIGKRFAKTRIDLSMGAFKQVADLKQGLISIKAEVVK